VLEAVRVGKFWNLSWEEFERDTRILAKKLLSLQKKWTGIISVTRGGLVPAAIVAEEMNIRNIETVSVIGYSPDDNNPEIMAEAKIVKAAHVGDGEGWLVIDDLVDTGRTVEMLRKVMPKAYFATVYAKPEGVRFADTYAGDVAQDIWIQFPWALIEKK